MKKFIIIILLLNTQFLLSMLKSIKIPYIPLPSSEEVRIRWETPNTIPVIEEKNLSDLMLTHYAYGETVEDGDRCRLYEYTGNFDEYTLVRIQHKPQVFRVGMESGSQGKIKMWCEHHKPYSGIIKKSNEKNGLKLDDETSKKIGEHLRKLECHNHWINTLLILYAKLGENSANYFNRLPPELKEQVLRFTVSK